MFFYLIQHFLFNLQVCFALPIKSDEENKTEEDELTDSELEEMANKGYYVRDSVLDKVKNHFLFGDDTVGLPVVPQKVKD